MLAVYKTRCAGPYHLKNKIPCQDAYNVVKSESGYVIAAIADGVGSSKKSDVASQIAVDTVASVCEGKLIKGIKDVEILEVLKTSFLMADANISKRAEEDDGNYDDYDTTLCVGVYDGNNLYYGQSGDSGLVGLTEDGEYVQVTRQQRDSENHVYPLCFGTDYWEFGKVEQCISAFALVTDGILEQVFPELLSKEEIKMNISLLERMLNYFDIEEAEIPELEKRMQIYWEKCPSYLIDDDKTSIGVINTSRPPQRKGDAYYKEPDWDNLIAKANLEREKIKERLYADISDHDEEHETLVGSVADSTVTLKVSNEMTGTTITDKLADIEKEVVDGVIKIADTLREEKIFVPLVSQSITRMVEQLKTSNDTVRKNNEEKNISSSKKENALLTRLDIKI